MNEANILSDEYKYNIVLIFNESGVITHCNINACMFYNYKQEELLKINYYDILENNSKEQVEKYIKHCISNNHIFGHYECMVNSRAGEISWLFNQMKIKSDNNNETLIEINSRDITTEKQTYLEVIQARKIAENEKRLEEKFIATVGHEIRTPMNAVVGIIDLMSKTNLDDKQKNYLKKLQISSNQILKIVNNLLEYKKITSGKIELINSPFSIKQLIDDQINVFEDQARDKNVEIVFNADVNIPDQVIGDDFRLGQIIQNLMSNAIKYTGDGQVTISVFPSKLEIDSIVILFEIKDTGIGIPQNKIDEIFDVYTQVENRRDGKIGTGLGLNIVKSLVEIQGGTIDAQSEEGAGTIFTFTIKYGLIKSEAITDNKAGLDQRICDLGKVRILLIDDDPLNIYIAKKYLQNFSNISVLSADTAINGLKLAINNELDIIFTDINMPELDGYQFAREIRGIKNNKISSVPIIALTADMSFHENEGNKYLNGGLIKPITRENLYKIIYETVLNSRELTENNINYAV